MTGGVKEWRNADRGTVPDASTVRNLDGRTIHVKKLKKTRRKGRRANTDAYTQQSVITD